MNKEYIIIDIKDGSHSKFDEIIIVNANPVKKNILGMKSYTTHFCNETKVFFFRNDPTIIDELVYIAHNRKLWMPNEEDFIIERMKNQDNANIVDIYCHNDLYNDSIDEDEGDGYTMIYNCLEYSLNQNKFIRLPEKQEWEITLETISTPYGQLSLHSYMKVNQGPLVGVQFDVKGKLDLSSITNAPNYINIKTVAIMRQPQNAWLWVYMFDTEDNNIINFCGHDEINGFMYYIQELEHSF